MLVHDFELENLFLSADEPKRILLISFNTIDITEPPIVGTDYLRCGFEREE